MQTHTVERHKYRNKLVPVVAGIVGGAAVITTAVALSDKKNRNKLKSIINNIKDKSLMMKNNAVKEMNEIPKQIRSKKKTKHNSSVKKS